jgi:hypothetical protein
MTAAQLGDTWPDSAARFEYPAGIAGADERWQQAVAEALAKTQLSIRSVGGDFYDLVGVCPRCGHYMTQSLEGGFIAPRGHGFNVIADVRFRGPLPVVDALQSIEIVCSCREEHDGRDDKDDKGCGWGRGLKVGLTSFRPVTDEGV